MVSCGRLSSIEKDPNMLRALESVVCEVLQRGFHLQGVLADGLRVNG